jgi:hypothetical protein
MDTGQDDWDVVEPQQLPDSVESEQLTDSIVSLADIELSGMRLEWYEALAVVLQLCQGVTESIAQTGRPTLRPDTVFIGAAGDVVALTGPQHPLTAIPQVVEIFGGMLPDFHRRSTFRTVIAAATSDPPEYASLDELAAQLVPFERPNRVEIVQGVYRRWREIAATTLPAESGALDVFISETAIPKTPAGSQIPKAAKPRVVKTRGARTRAVKELVSQVVWRVRLVPWRRVAGVAALVIAIAGVGYLGYAALQWSRRSVAIAGTRATDTQSSSGVSEAPALAAESSVQLPARVRESDPARRGPAPRATAPATPALPVYAPLRMGAATSALTAPTNSPVTAAVSDGSVEPLLSVPATAPRSTPDQLTLAAPPTTRGTAASESRPAVPPSPPLQARQEPAPAALSRRFSTPATTFSASDLDVVPPVPDTSQILWRMPASSRAADLVAIEIVVNEHGAVESVKAIDRTNNIADAFALTMSLSAAKSWHFHPALKDGLPVKYRQIIPLTMR